jgi:hypothetical protein
MQLKDKNIRVQAVLPGATDALYVRTHYDGMTVTLPPETPAADEVALIICLASRGRLNARVGGIAANEIGGEDGLR